MPANKKLKRNKKGDTPTPKYNKGWQPQRPHYLVTVDWLELMLTGKISLIEEALTHGEIKPSYTINKDLFLAVNYEQSHPGFQFCFNVILHSQDFGHLYYKSTGVYRFTNTDSVQFRVHNEIFYRVDYSKQLSQIINGLGLVFSHYYRMDIALDGCGILPKANELLQHKNWKQVRKVKVKTEFDTTSKLFNNVQFGSRSSNKFVTLYNKSKEIKKDKQYIGDYWSLNNLSQSEMIDRLELRMYSQSLKHFSHELNQLENPDYLASYFRSSAEKYFEFYNKYDSQQRASIIDWSCFKNISVTKPETIFSQNNLQGIKSALKCLTMEYYGTNNDLTDAIVIIAKQYNLLDWVADRVKHRWKPQLRLKVMNLIRTLREAQKKK